MGTGSRNGAATPPHGRERHKSAWCKAGALGAVVESALAHPHAPCRHAFPTSPSRKPPPPACDGHKPRGSRWTPVANPSHDPAHSGTDLQLGRAVRVPDAADLSWTWPSRPSTSRPATPGPVVRPRSHLFPLGPACFHSSAHAPPTLPPDGRPCGPMVSSRDLPIRLQTLARAHPACARSPAHVPPTCGPIARAARHAGR